MFYKIRAIRNFAKFNGKHSCRCLFNEVAGWNLRCFPGTFATSLTVPFYRIHSSGCFSKQKNSFAKFIRTAILQDTFKQILLLKHSLPCAGVSFQKDTPTEGMNCVEHILYIVLHKIVSKVTFFVCKCNSKYDLLMLSIKNLWRYLLFNYSVVSSTKIELLTGINTSKVIGTASGEG